VFTCISLIKGVFNQTESTKTFCIALACTGTKKTVLEVSTFKRLRAPAVLFENQKKDKLIATLRLMFGCKTDLALEHVFDGARRVCVINGCGSLLDLLGIVQAMFLCRKIVSNQLQSRTLRKCR
jgi:hypothetical protein